jgi:hypothetical protein
MARWQVPLPISDGTAGGIEEGSITLPLCTELVDEWTGRPAELEEACRLAAFIHCQIDR